MVWKKTANYTEDLYEISNRISIVDVLFVKE
jgi:hypothetical protein